MALESGKYFIFSMLHGAPVGRNLIEDSSLLPKAIYKLPDGSEPSVWDVEKLPNGNYKLLNRRAAVGALEGRLLAFLIDGEALLDSLEWSIQRADGRDPDGDTYVVTRPDDPDGWVANETEPEIAVRPLTVGPSEPPFYPPNEVFIFNKVLGDFD